MPKCPDVDPLGGADLDELATALATLARRVRQRPERSVGGERQVEDALEAHVPQRPLSLDGGPLHDGAHQVVGDHHHEHRLARHLRCAHFEELQPERGLQDRAASTRCPSAGRRVRTARIRRRRELSSSVVTTTRSRRRPLRSS